MSLKRPELNEDDFEVMIANYEQDVLRAAERGAAESSRIFEIHQTDMESADLCEYAVPDTACRKTLVGEVILQGIEKRLNQKGLRVIRRHEKNEFRFGNAGTLISSEVAQIPLWLGRRRVVVHAAVLLDSGSLTLFLFSKELFRKLECVLDMKNDQCVFHRLDSTPIKLKRTACGHYAIPVLEAPSQNEVTTLQDPQASYEQPACKRAHGEPSRRGGEEPGEFYAKNNPQRPRQTKRNVQLWDTRWWRLGSSRARRPTQKCTTRRRST